MDQQGWQSFLNAEGVDDWVVLHGGATAVFSLKSLFEVADLAKAIVQVPGVEGSGALITLANCHLTIRLTRDIWSLESRHIQMALAVSVVARKYGAVAVRSAVQEVQIAIASKHETMDLAFWRAVLGYDAMAEDNAVDPLGHGSTVWMQEISEEKTLRHAMHIDISVARENVEARLEAAIAAGGRVVDDSNAPSHWILSDKAGNKVCICGWPDGK